MSWFSRKPTKIVVVHKIDRLDDILVAIREAAEIRRGFHDPPRPEPVMPPVVPRSPHDLDFDKFLATSGGTQNMRGHLRACMDILLGRREPEGEWTRANAREILVRNGAPIPDGL